MLPRMEKVDTPDRPFLRPLSAVVVQATDSQPKLHCIRAPMGWLNNKLEVLARRGQGCVGRRSRPCCAVCPYCYTSMQPDTRSRSPPKPEVIFEAARKVSKPANFDSRVGFSLFLIETCKCSVFYVQGWFCCYAWAKPVVPGLRGIRKVASTRHFRHPQIRHPWVGGRT